MCMISSWYVLWFFVFLGVLSVFLLRKMWPEKKCYGFWLSQVFYEVLIRITSNLLHGFIVSCLSICAWFPVDIFYDFLYFWVFFHCFYWPVLIRFTSNLLHGFIVSYSSICGCLQVDIFYYFSAFLVFLSQFLLINYNLGKCQGFWFNLVYYQVLIKITSNLVYGFIVSDSSICWCFQADIFYNFLHFFVFLSLYLLIRMWLVKSVKDSD